MQTEPRLSDYDFVILNTSAGKDSQTAMRYVISQAKAEGYPLARIIGAHADLAPYEWPDTAELARRHCDHYGIQLLTARRAQGLLEHIEARGMWPDSGNRYCTSDHKRDQIAKLFTQLVATLPHSRQARILNVMGMRAEESPARAKLAPLARNTRATSGRRLVDTWLPIHSWRLADVWADIKASGVPHHHAYNLGMPRLSCVFCIFSPPPALMLAGKANPELLARYVDAEQRMGHTFRHNFSLASVKAAIDRGEDWGPASDWVM